MEKKLVSRNEYFNLISELGISKTENEYEIEPLNLAKYKLAGMTQRIADNNFMKETTDRNGNYMLEGHWFSDLCYSFAKVCEFTLIQIDAYSSYAYSDEQMAVFTYCEGDITLTPFENKADYEREKERTIKFYKERY